MNPRPHRSSYCLENLPIGSFSLSCLLACTVLAGPCAAAEPDSSPVVDVSGGSIRGRILPENRGSVFRGIPFAQPPVGNLRWREPMPVMPWSGIRNCTQSGPPAEQPALGWNDKAAAASGEDCLYLDLWAPVRRSGDRIPVMVWLHGGGNVAGAGGFDPLYDGEALISHGVILVVVEYRLGVFGFLAHPELTRESPHHASGNYGILDQIAALQWVHANIKKFGGDPRNVTLFGQSAGAMDVLALMASPLSRGLFQRAISESGPLGPQSVQSLADAEQAGANAVEGLGVPGRKDARQLRALAPGDLMKARIGSSPFTTDGWVFPVSAFDAWRDHKELAVPLVIGANAMEFAASGAPDRITSSIRDFFKDSAPAALSLYGLSGDGGPPATDPLYGNAADQWGSDLFRCAGIIEGGWHSRANACWEYEFDRAIPPHPRVAHSGDLPYVFGNLKVPGSMAGDYQDADRRLVAAIQAYWTNFAKTGNPNGPGLPLWQPYETGGKKYLDFTTEAEVVLKANERGPFVDLFRAVLERPSSVSAAAP